MKGEVVETKKLTVCANPRQGPRVFLQFRLSISIL